MAAVTTEKPVNADFIGRSIAGRGMLNFQKGTWYGSLFAISQAYGSAYYSHVKVANAASKAMDLDALNKTAISNMKTFIPIIAGFEQGSGVGSLSAWAKATAFTAVPTAAFLALRKPVPAPVLFGLYSTFFLHGYDRVLKSLTPYSEHMVSNRRQF